MRPRHAIVFTILLLTGCDLLKGEQADESAPPAKSAQPAPPQPTKSVATTPPPPSDGFSDKAAKTEITRHYNSRGQWRGKFTLVNIARMRVDKVSETQKVVHVEYEYDPLPGNPRKAGSDKRTFEFVKDGDAWVIKSMGEYMSASFDDDQLGWSDQQAIADITTFYDSQGQWKGKFKLARVDRYRADRESATAKVVFAGYTYEPLPGNPRPAGTDQRKFYFKKDNDKWVVHRMGPHLSAAAGLRSKK